MAKKIEDFGEKIEGARKDLYSIKKGAVKLTDDILLGWSELERNEYICKDLVWNKPNYQKLYKDEGYEREALYFMKCVRDALPTKPVRNNETYQRGYVNFVSDIKDWIKDVKTAKDIEPFCENFLQKYMDNYDTHYPTPSQDTYGCMNRKLANTMYSNPRAMEFDMKKKQFLFSDEEKLMDKHIMIIAAPKDYHHTRVNTRKENYVSIYLYTSSMGSYLSVPCKIPEGVDKNDFMDKFDTNCADCETDKYFVISRKCEMLYSGIDSKEEAERLALEYAQKAEGVMIQKQPEQPKKASKDKLLPPQLEHIERIGTEHRERNKDIDTDDILECFKLRGGQFGEWLNEKDKQANMNMSFDAFRDLAVALDIPYEDISLKRSSQEKAASLAIAYGARGHSRALAHYEPVQNVINLTKMKGAGSLAHEWGHALDSFVMKELDFFPSMTAKKSQKYMASHCYSPENPFNEVVRAMQMKETENGQTATDYYLEARKTDDCYASTDNGYWRSNCEMFARAFACYVHDKLEEKGIRSDYLCGHSEATVCPRGEEREAINAAIDNLITDLKQRGLLHHKVHDIEAEAVKAPAAPMFSHDDTPYNLDDFGEQLSLFDLFDMEEETLPSKTEVETAPVAAEMPVPTSEDKFDLTQIDFQLAFSGVESAPEVGAIARFSVTAELNEAQTDSLIERADITGFAGEGANTEAYFRDKEIYLDVYADGDMELVLAIDKGFEFNIQLSEDEHNIAKGLIETEFGVPVEDRMSELQEEVHQRYEKEMKDY